MNYFIYTSRHFTPHGRHELNKLTSLPMCGFIAQLVEHRNGVAEVTGWNPVEALIFSGVFFPIAQIGKLTAMIILHFASYVLVTCWPTISRQPKMGAIVHYYPFSISHCPRHGYMGNFLNN